jgi:hypothetical protein
MTSRGRWLDTFIVISISVQSYSFAYVFGTEGVDTSKGKRDDGPRHLPHQTSSKHSLALDQRLWEIRLSIELLLKRLWLAEAVVDLERLLVGHLRTSKMRILSSCITSAPVELDRKRTWATARSGWRRMCFEFKTVNVKE